MFLTRKNSNEIAQRRMNFSKNACLCPTELKKEKRNLMKKRPERNRKKKLVKLGNVLVVEERHNRPIRQVDRDQLTETDRVEPGRLYTHTTTLLTESAVYTRCVCVHSNLVPHLFSTTTTFFLPPSFLLLLPSAQIKKKKTASFLCR